MAQKKEKKRTKRGALGCVLFIKKTNKVLVVAARFLSATVNLNSDS
jgi:hypothetical protein